LIHRLGRRAYKPLASKRVYIPKNEHEKRPLGISAIETTVVESAVTRILRSIYEVDFLPCSYGFRPGRCCHDALNALDEAIMFSPVNHIVEADIKGFVDNVSHDRLMEFLKIRIGDTAMLELIGKFLKAGFMDQGEYNETHKGTPQGSILSPLLSNIYLHYTLDTWFTSTVRAHVQGYVQLVRSADDFVIAVQYQNDAARIERAVKNRFAKYGLEIHPTKSRTIRFGRYEKQNAARRGRKPNTFGFLGFTHFCDKTQSGKYKLGRKTQRKKFVKACTALWDWLKGIRNRVKAQDWWKTLESKLRGHFNHYGISGNHPAIKRFYIKTLAMTRYWLNRRSQRKTLNWEKFWKYLERHPLPKPEIKHAIYRY
jgi:group II intron reverse transcriptase/maturase